MIRKDIKLTESQVNGFELLPNAPDPEERYLYSRELDLVMNKETGVLMEYYWDDMPDGYEIPLDRVLVMEGVDIPTDKLGISVFYHNEYRIKTPSNRILKFEHKSDKTCRNKYPRISIKGERFKSLMLHRLTARLYIPNPENRPIVNHRGVKKDYYIQYKKEDLCWFTLSENQLFDKKIKDSGIRYVALDSKGGEVGVYSSKELADFLKIKTSSSSISRQIVRSINSGNKYRKYFWKTVNVKVINYRNYLISSGHLTPEKWYENDNIWKSKDLNGIIVEANLNGVVRIRYPWRKDYNYLAGDTRWVYNGVNKSLYTIVAVIFNDQYSSFEEINGLEVDHLNSDWRDNRPCNLRLVTHSENMNNPFTKEKLSKEILCYDLFGNFLKLYKSATEYSQSMGKCASHAINDIARVRYSTFQTNGHLLFYESTVKYLSIKLRYVYYKFDVDGNKLIAGTRFIDLLDENKNRSSYYPYLNTGIPAPDGYYYQQGPDFLKDENGKYGKKIRSIIHWKNLVLSDDFPEDLDLEDEP